MISVAEYAARVRRLRTLFPDLESKYNDDEGLTLDFRYGPQRLRAVFTGELSIIVEAEALARSILDGSVRDFAGEVTYEPFKNGGR